MALTSSKKTLAIAIRNRNTVLSFMWENDRCVQLKSMFCNFAKK